MTPDHWQIINQSYDILCVWHSNEGRICIIENAVLTILKKKTQSNERRSSVIENAVMTILKKKTESNERRSSVIENAVLTILKKKTIKWEKNFCYRKCSYDHFENEEKR